MILIVIIDTSLHQHGSLYFFVAPHTDITAPPSLHHRYVLLLARACVHAAVIVCTAHRFCKVLSLEKRFSNLFYQMIIAIMDRTERRRTLASHWNDEKLMAGCAVHPLISLHRNTLHTCKFRRRYRQNVLFLVKTPTFSICEYGWIWRHLCSM